VLNRVLALLGSLDAAPTPRAEPLPIDLW